LAIFFNQYFTFLCSEWRILISSREAERSPVLYYSPQDSRQR
jgi:hypothetical protein